MAGGAASLLLNAAVAGRKREAAAANRKPREERPGPQGHTPMRVQVRVDPRWGFGRKAASAFVRYAKSHTNWLYSVSTVRHRELMEEIFGNADAYLHATPDLEGLDALLETGCPIINIAGNCDGRGCPSVIPDNVAVGRAAGEHLVSCGARSFCFEAWNDDGLDATRRLAGFEEFVAGADGRVRCFAKEVRGMKRVSQAKRAAAFCEWIQTLDKPVGLFGSYDGMAGFLSILLREHGLLVPDEVAILGSENDSWHFEFTDPPLSSIDLAADRIGAESARALQRWLEQGEKPDQTQLVEPATVIGRASTDVHTGHDPGVAAAMRLIRENVCNPLTVKQLATHVGVSRRTLENRFQREFRRTPHEVITHLRMQHVKELLVGTDLPLEQIARRCGFSQPHHLTRSFRTSFGTTPHEYRQQLKTTADAT